MINPSSYEELFIQGFEDTKKEYEDEGMALTIFQNFVNFTFVDDADECLKKAMTGFKNKKLPEIRGPIHTLKGRLRYFYYFGDLFIF